MKAGIALISVLLAAVAVFGQEYPDRIDGYKVHKKPIVVRSIGKHDDDRDVDLTFTEPKFVGASLTAVKFELGAQVSSKRSASIDKIRIDSLTVNGISVKVKDLEGAFELKANEPVKLPEPFAAEVSSFGAAKAAWLGLTDPKKMWQVKGRAYIFGRFKRFGMTFLRAIPVEFDVLVKNPMR